MRVFVTSIEVQALEVTAFLDARRSWLPGVYHITGLGEDAQRLTWIVTHSDQVPTLGTYVEVEVRKHVETYTLPERTETYTTWEVVDARGVRR